MMNSAGNQFSARNALFGNDVTGNKLHRMNHGQK